MTTFKELYSDDDGTFYEELYPLAEKYLILGKHQLQSYIQDAKQKEWDVIRNALISISSDMCFHYLHRTLQRCKSPTSINYANISLAIERSIQRHNRHCQ